MILTHCPALSKLAVKLAPQIDIHGCIRYQSPDIAHSKFASNGLSCRLLIPFAENVGLAHSLPCN